MHFAGWLTGEDEVGSRKDAAQIGERRFHFTSDLAGGHVDRRHAAGDLERLARAAAGPELPRFQFVGGHHLDLDAIAALDHRDVPELQIRIVGRRRPVLAAHVAGADVGFKVAAAWRHRGDVGLHGLVRVILDRLAALRVESFGPCDFLDERQAPDELAGGAIDRIGEAVAVRFERELPRTTRPGNIDQHVFRYAVIVVGVIWRVLIVPLDLAGGGVKGQRAVGVKVVAWPIFIIPVRSRISGAPDDGVGWGIVGAGYPGRTTAGGCRVVAVFPGIAAGLALARDGVGAPDLLLGRKIGRGNPATDAVLRAGHACYRHVLDDQRRAGDHLALVRIGDRTLPGDLAGFLIGGDQPAIQRVGDDEIAPQRHAAVVDAAARDGASPITVC